MFPDLSFLERKVYRQIIREMRCFHKYCVAIHKKMNNLLGKVILLDSFHQEDLMLSSKLFIHCIEWARHSFLFSKKQIFLWFGCSAKLRVYLFYNNWPIFFKC